jgi:hypothetical protein
VGVRAVNGVDTELIPTRTRVDTGVGDDRSMTTITNHTDPTVASEAGPVPSPIRRVAKPLAGLVVGLALGWFAGSVTADPSPAATDVSPAPPAVVEVPLSPNLNGLSPDAYDRWVQAQRAERIENGANGSDGVPPNVR